MDFQSLVLGSSAVEHFDVDQIGGGTLRDLALHIQVAVEDLVVGVNWVVGLEGRGDQVLDQLFLKVKSEPLVVIHH